MAPITGNQRKYMVKNSCAFDSIVQILTMLAMNIPDSMKQLEESSNDALGFVLVFLKHEEVDHVYL